MQVRNRLNTEVPLNKLVIYPVVTLLYMLFTVMVFFIPGGPGYNFRENYYWLIFPLEIFLVGLTSMQFAAYFFKGSWAQVLSRSCFVLGNGISLFLFWFLAASDIETKLAGLGIIPVTVSIIIYKVSRIYENRVYKGEIIKVISYLIAGFSVYFMFNILWPESESYTGGFSFSLGRLTLYSFIVLSLFELASLIELSGNQKAYGMANWFRSNHGSKFLVFLLSCLYWWI